MDDLTRLFIQNDRLINNKNNNLKLTNNEARYINTVSYTHLTLPTTPYV